MKIQSFKCGSVWLLLALALGLGRLNQAFGQDCLISFDGPAGNVLTSYIDSYPNWPNCPATFDTVVQVAGQPVPVGTYSTWCIDAGTDLDPSQNNTVLGTTYSGLLFPTCDTNLNNELPSGHTPTSYVSPAVWQQVNYLLNHQNGTFFWAVQVAINDLVGGPTPPSPPYPPYNTADVQALLNDASNNAAAWVPQCGDVIGAVYVLTAQAGVTLTNPVQFLVVEVPYCPITFTTTPTNLVLGCNPVPSSIPDVQNPVNTNLVFATSCCGYPLTITCTKSEANLGCLEYRYLTFTATDGYANTATYTQTISWTNDTTAPVILSAPTNTDLGCNPSPATLPTDASVTAQVTASQGCSPSTVIVSHVDSGSACATNRTFTITAIDGCSNSSAPLTVVYTWTVDTTAPVITGYPTNTNLGCNPSVTNLPTDAGVAAQIVATDNCSVASTNVSHVDGGSACETNRTFTVTVTDECGNTSAPVTLVYTWSIDTNAPVITYTPAGGYLGYNPTNLPTDVSVAVQVVATDNCTVASTNVSHVDGGSACATNRTFTITATDECGNTSAPVTLVFTWAVDTTAPVVTTVPAGGYLGCNPTNLPTVTTVTAGVVATDNCVVQSTNVTSGTTTNGITVTRTFTVTATDGAGNTSAPKTVVYTWTIDSTTPVITHVPTGGYLGCNPTNLPTTASVAAQVAATNLCPLVGTNVSVVTSTNGITITRTFTISATDECGYTSATNTVVYTWTIDTTSPVITHVPTGGYLGCNPTNLPTTASVAAQVAATNLCPLVSTNVSVATATNGITVTRTYGITATDECGNTSATNTVVYTWTIDTTAPVITHLPTGGYLGCNPTNLPTTASVAAQVAATNLCPLVSTNVSVVTTTNGITITRTFSITATDECGFVSAPQTVIYTWTIDTTSPVITHLPTGGYLGCNPTNLPTTASVAAQVVGTNLCPLVSTNVSVATVTNGITVTRTFSITVTDQCGNTSATNTVVYTWTIDTTAPVITHVPAGGNLGCNPATLPTVASVSAQVTATNNCSIQSLNVTDVDTTNNCTVTSTFTITATDACGNVSAPTNVVYTWTADTTPPIVTCPPAYLTTNGYVPYCTFTPGDYGAPCNGTNGASCLTNWFAKVYTNGWLQCGLTNGGFCLKFNNCGSVQKLATCGGAPGCLKASYTNATSCEAGVFAAQAVCLKLNVDFSDCKSVTNIASGCGDLVLNDCTSPLNGWSVRQIEGLCHTALGGGNISSCGCTLGNLSLICSNLNQAFENCNPSAWSLCHLVPAGITNVPPSVSGYAVVQDKCSSTPTLTYSDVITNGACAQTYVIARTWTAVDGCGNSNSCTQDIYIGGSQASVCGNVFLDCNGDGILTPGIDSGLTNILVTLKNANNVIVATNLTDLQGSYCFYNLTAGTYTVHVTVPTNYVETAGTSTPHWLNGNGQQCWNENDGYQHCKTPGSTECWTASDNCQHTKNSNNQDCWTDKNGGYHSQPCTYVSCDVPTNDAETFTLAPCQNLTCVNFSYQGAAAKSAVCVTGPSHGVCGQWGAYTCCVTNVGTACFSACQVTACGNSYTCPSLSPGQGCSFQINYQYRNSDFGNFNCQATANCTAYPCKNSNVSCSNQGNCQTSVGWW